MVVQCSALPGVNPNSKNPCLHRIKKLLINLLSFTLDDSLSDITIREFGFKLDENQMIRCFNGYFLMM